MNQLTTQYRIDGPPKGSGAHLARREKTARRGVWVVSSAMALVAALMTAACGASNTAKKQPNVAPTVAPGVTPNEHRRDDGLAVNDAASSDQLQLSKRPTLKKAAKQPYMQALKAFGEGDLATAKKLFERTIALDDNAYQAHYSLGVVLERLRDNKAAAHYRYSYTIVPDYEPAITAFGLLTARQGRALEADQFLTDRHTKLPRSAAVATALAEVKSLQRDTASAQRLAQYALKENPNYAPAMVTLARDHYRNRRLDLAKYALQAILDGFGPDNPPRNTGNVEARLLRAVILKEEGNRAGAIAELEQVMGKRADLVDAGVQLATYYLESGNAAKAQPLLERALRYQSDNMVAHLNLADVYRLSNRPELAKQEFEWVLARDSGQIQVHYNLGLLYLFSDAFPGMTAMQQVNAAIHSLERYKELRGRAVSSQGSDVEQLLLRARAKKAMLEAEAKASQTAAVQPASNANNQPAAKDSTTPQPTAPGAGKNTKPAETKSETKPGTKPDTKPETKPGTKPETKPPSSTTQKQPSTPGGAK